MRIYRPIKFKGANKEITKPSLIDTGDSISLIPIELAWCVGVWRTNQDVNVIVVHGQQRRPPLGKVGIFFPDLGNKGGDFLVAVSDVEKESIIGMNILRTLGINIDTKTGELSIKK